MSRARPVRKGETLLVTKRTSKRQFLLRPSAIVNQVILYVIGVIALKRDLLLHAICALSNHPHTVATDPEGNIVDFTRDAHSFIARAINARFREEENLWSTKPTSRVSCLTRDSIVDKIGYALANPVAAFLVKFGKSWPGVRVSWPMEPITVPRPRFFFRGPDRGGVWPDEVTITFARPPGFDDLTDEQLKKRVDAATDMYEDEARAEAEREGIEFLGRRAVLRVSRYAFPKLRERLFRLSPQFAGRDRKARQARIEENKLWQARYGEARDRFIGGERDVVFPYGTYKLVRLFGARCEAAPT